jgi:cell division protein FtsZ
MLVQGAQDMRLHEVNEAVRMVNEAVSPEANIIFGATIDDTLGDEIRITVVAAGFDPATQRMKPVERRPMNVAEPVATVAATTAVTAAVATGFGFDVETQPVVSDATGVIDTVDEDVIPFPKPAEQGFGDDLDIPDFLK